MAESLGDRIRIARKEAGLRREELAVELDVSLRTIARLETGETVRISVEMLSAIAKATRHPLEFFVNGMAA